MGLDVSYGCWSGAYSAFSRWREGLATAAGYAVWQVKHADGMVMSTVMLDWGHLGGRAHLVGEWEETPADPLLVLIIHCDDEGRIYPAQAGPLADRLESLIPLLTDKPDLGHIGDWRTKTQKFVDGLRRGVAADQPVEFG